MAGNKLKCCQNQKNSMIETETITRTCECGENFIPRYRNGLLISKHCPECIWIAERLKRIATNRQSPHFKTECVESPVIAIKKDAPIQGNVKNKVRRTSISSLVKKLDKEFSIFIRNRDTKNGAFKCISCGQIKAFRLADCGHYVSRSHMATRWDEMNCAAQCSHDNRFRQGEIQNFRQGLIKRYGVEAVDKIEQKKYGAVHFTNSELQEKIDYYKAKNRDDLLEGRQF